MKEVHVRDRRTNFPPEHDPAAMADAELETQMDVDEELPQDLDVEAIAAERDRYLDQLQRTLADFANYRKRIDQERILARQLATRDLLQALVPIIDDFERALAAVPEAQRATPWVEGVELIERKLAALLDREGVAKVDALGQPFDPALHEAVATDPDNHDNVVVEVYQQGYQQGKHLLRPAMVKVGNLPPSA